ncbi:MAG: multidrug resistance efflux transporter family protein [Desulfatirhabdiaceae bacterium]
MEKDAPVSSFNPGRKRHDRGYSMVRLILIGLLSGFFFSSTFVLNRMMSLEGGHWVWSAGLRYGYMILFLVVWLVISRGMGQTVHILKRFYRHLLFWVMAGSIGFGGFYALICFGADHAPGWVIAATWQFTIIATLVVLTGFGRRFPKKVWIFSGIVFAGVLMVNISQSDGAQSHALLKGALPMLLAAFCYPLGNQMVWEAVNGHDRLPNIWSPELDHPFVKILFMSLGSIPFWCALVAVTAPPAPSSGQLVKTALVAVLSGVLATGFFFFARNQAKTGNQLAAVDATQSSEVIFALIAEVLIIGAALPNFLGMTGIAVTGLGIMLFIWFQESGG